MAHMLHTRFPELRWFKAPLQVRVGVGRGVIKVSTQEHRQLFEQTAFTGSWRVLGGVGIHAIGRNHAMSLSPRR